MDLPSWCFSQYKQFFLVGGACRLGGMKSCWYQIVKNYCTILFQRGNLDWNVLFVGGGRIGIYSLSSVACVSGSLDQMRPAWKWTHQPRVGVQWSVEALATRGFNVEPGIVEQSLGQMRFHNSPLIRKGEQLGDWVHAIWITVSKLRGALFKWTSVLTMLYVVQWHICEVFVLWDHYPFAMLV